MKYDKQNNNNNNVVDTVELEQSKPHIIVEIL
jgi:hypothetical protein